MTQENSMKCLPIHDSGLQCEIVVHGRLTADWSEWFSGLKLHGEGETTTLSGQLSDQSALLGVLNKINGLNLSLISITCVVNSNETDPAEP